MNRGVNGTSIVIDDTDRQMFLDAIGHAASTTPAEIHAYCVMTNHYHLLVHAPATALADCVRSYTQRYSRSFNHRHDRYGPLFAGRYHDVAVESDAQLVAVLRYIALNPIAIDRFDVDRYEWSSHGAYLRDALPSWLATTVYDWFDGVDDYRSYIDAARHDADALVETVRIASDEVAVQRESRWGDVRDAALLLADDLDEPLASQVVAAVVSGSANAVRTARHRARRRAHEAALRVVVERVMVSARRGSVRVR